MSARRSVRSGMRPAPLRASGMLALVLFWLGCPSGDPDAASGGNSRPPNILLILADDLAYDDLGSYGSPDIATPAIDALAAEGVRFENAYSSGNFCIPTRVSIMTGNDPMVAGRGAPLMGYTLQSKDTLPRRLQDIGYETYHVGKWHLGHTLPDHMPKAVGFDHYFGWPMSDIPFGLPVDRQYDRPSLKRDDHAPEIVEGHLIDILTNEAIGIIARHGDEGISKKPFFINLWHLAPHAPMVPQARWAEHYPATGRGLFAALVAGLDESVQRVLAALDESGLAENTLVVFASDNGGAIDTHPDGIARLRGFKTEYYEGGIRVPLIVRWPAALVGGSVSDRLVTSADLFPTLLDAAYGEARFHAVEGESFLPARSRAGPRGIEANPAARTLYWPHEVDVREPGLPEFFRCVVREGDWKLIIDQSEHQYRPTDLYDLAADPGETRNLIDEFPERVAALRQKYVDRQAREIDRISLELQLQGEVEAHPDPGTNEFEIGDGLLRIAHSPSLDLINNAFSFRVEVRPAPDGSRTDGIGTDGSGADRLIAGKGEEWQLALVSGGLQFSVQNGDGSISRLRFDEGLVPSVWSAVGFDVFNRSLGTSRSVNTTYRLLLNDRVVATTQFEREVRDGQTTVKLDPSDVTLGNNSSRSTPLRGAIRNPTARHSR